MDSDAAGALVASTGMVREAQCDHIEHAMPILTKFIDQGNVFDCDAPIIKTAVFFERHDALRRSQCYYYNHAEIDRIQSL